MIRKAKLNDDGTWGTEEVVFNDPGTSVGTLKWLVEVDELGNIVSQSTEFDTPFLTKEELDAQEEDLRERQALIEAGIIGLDEPLPPYNWEKEGDFAA